MAEICGTSQGVGPLQKAVLHKRSKVVTPEGVSYGSR